MRTSKRKSELLGGRFLARLTAESSGEALLQNLHDGRGSALDRLAYKQMNVVGHHDVARERKPMTIAHLAQDLDEQIPGADRVE